MKKTTNLGLDLFGIALLDRQQKFKTWRLAMCGEDDSNMIKIDNKIGQIDSAIATKAEKSYVDSELAKKANDVLATPSLKGQMSPADKAKLDSIILGTGDTTIDITNHNINESAHPFIQTKIDDKVKINNEASNVNFIRNEIVKDGLIEDYIPLSKVDLYFKFSYENGVNDSYIASCVSVQENNGFGIFARSGSKYEIYVGNRLIVTNLIANKYDLISLRIDGSKLIFKCNNGTFELNDVVYNIPNRAIKFNGTGVKYYYSMLYNRPLTSQEVQHNLSVLNNSESINKINGYAISTDTDHITDRTGRVQDTINRVFYKQNCKEFASDGSAISVNNGMDGYVLSGKIEGQTVKNYCNTINNTNVTDATVDTSLNLIKINHIEGVTNLAQIKSAGVLKASTEYDIVVFVKSNPDNLLYIYGDSGTAFNFVRQKVNITNGIAIITKTTVSDLTNVNRDIKFAILNTDATTNAEFSVVIVESGVGKIVKSYIPLGLNSTQAVVYNNNLKYSFYSPVIEGTTAGLAPTITFNPVLPTLVTGDVLDLATKTITFANTSKRVLTDEELKAYDAYKKVILCDKVEDVADTLEIKEDGSGVYTRNTKTVKLRDLKWSNLSSNGLLSNVLDSKPFDTSQKGGICDMYDYDTWNVGVASQGVLYFHPNKDLQIKIREGQTQNELRSEILNSNAIFKYQLETPIVTHIPKEAMPTILTHDKINNLSFGEAVAPTSVTIKAPTTDDITKSYTVSLLNAYTQTVGTAAPVVDLLKDGKVRLQMDLTAPTTGMNATLFAAAPELRPVTNQRIPIFVNGVCVLGTVDKTTGNVNLPSVPSANANIYIKTDYRRDI